MEPKVYCIMNNRGRYLRLKENNNSSEFNFLGTAYSWVTGLNSATLNTDPDILREIMKTLILSNDLTRDGVFLAEFSLTKKEMLCFEFKTVEE